MQFTNIFFQARSFDHFVFNQINDLAGRYLWLDTLGIFLADYFQYLIILAVFLIFKKRWQIYAQGVSAVILSRLIIAEPMRILIHRLRPFMANDVNRLLHNEISASFPSGHSSAFFALATIIYLYNKKIGLWFFAAAFLITLGRIFSGVHYPLDILAGFLIGIFSGWLIYRLKIFKGKN